MGGGVKAGVENGAMLTTYLFNILQNAPFRSQIFKIFFASGGKWVLTPLTKILRTPLGLIYECRSQSAIRASELSDNYVITW